jgi:YD repeat-containing protein
MNETIVFLHKIMSLLLLSLICILVLHPNLAIAQSVSYQYDSWHRLTNATYENGVTISYTYDAVGNRLAEDITTTGNAAASANDQASTAALDVGVTSNTSDSKILSKPTLLSKINNTSAGIAGVIGLNESSSQDRSKNGNAIIQPKIAGNDDIPPMVVYENADDGTTKRWAIPDGPSGAYIDNVYDSEQDGRVIELHGDGLLNGFWLVNNDGTWWNNTVHNVIQWSMKYSNDFVISVAAQTSSGLRYISFTPDETDALGTETNVFYGLGAGSKDGKWHTCYIDISYALNEAQPNTTILSLLGFHVRGSGQIDDIQTLKEIPATLDPNGDGVFDIEGKQSRDQSVP